MNWIIVAKMTDKPRDRHVATLAGVLPDLDGFGIRGKSERKLRAPVLKL